MVKMLTLKEIAAKKNLIRQGLYWEALDLSRDCSMKDIALRIAELKQACGGDQEFSLLLTQVKNDFATGNYLDARRIYDDFFTRMGDEFSYHKLVVDDEVVSREEMWAEFRCQISYPNCLQTIREKLTSRMRNLGVSIVNETQEKLLKHKIDARMALRATSKSIKALEIARVYSDEPTEIEEAIAKVQDIYDNMQLAKVEEIKERLDKFEISLDAALEEVRKILRSRWGKEDLIPEEKNISGLLCRNYGISLINKAQETAKTNPNFALGEVRKGLEAMERAKEYGHDPQNIDALLDQGKKIFAALEKAQQLDGLQQIRARINRCVSRINEVLENENKKDVPAQESIAKVESILHEMEEMLPQVSGELVTSEPGLRGFFQRRQYKHVVSSDRKQLESLIQGAQKVLARLYLARGISQVNKAQEEAMKVVQKGRFDYMSSDATTNLEEALGTLMSLGLADLEMALNYNPKDGHIKEQLKIAKSIQTNLSSLVLGNMVRRQYGRYAF